MENRDAILKLIHVESLIRLRPRTKPLDYGRKNIYKLTKQQQKVPSFQVEYPHPHSPATPLSTLSPATPREF